MTDVQADAWVAWASDNHPASARLPRQGHAILMKIARAARRELQDPVSTWIVTGNALWTAGVDDDEIWMESHGYYHPWADRADRGLGETDECPECHDEPPS